MAWLAFDSDGHGVGCDETPEQVRELMESSVGWLELHDAKGVILIPEPSRIMYIETDRDERQQMFSERGEDE